MNTIKKALNKAMKQNGIDFKTRIEILEQFQKEYVQESVAAYMVDLGNKLFVTPKLEEKVFTQVTTDPYIYGRYATGTDVVKLNKSLMPITTAL